MQFLARVVLPKDTTLPELRYQRYATDAMLPMIRYQRYIILPTLRYQSTVWPEVLLGVISQFQIKDNRYLPRPHCAELRDLSFGENRGKIPYINYTYILL